jgi:preprotein translocase subunit SecD
VARSTTASRPARTLGVLAVLLALLFGTVGAGVLWSNAQWSPKLGLDLEGGTQIILTPVPIGGKATQISATQLQEAVQIIRQRINGSGVSEAEVTTQGADNIVVSLPGNPDQATRDRVKNAAQLRFRAVLVAQPSVTTPLPTGTASPTAGATPTAGGTPTGTASPTASSGASVTDGSTAAPTPSTSTNGRAIPKALVVAGSTPTPTTSPQPSSTANPAATPAAGATPNATPTNDSDLSWITPQLEQQFTALDCTDPANRQGGGGDDPAQPLVACSDDGQEKYILGPAEVVGTDVSNAVAALQTNQQGFTTGAWEVRLTFTSEGGRKFAAVTERLAAFPQTDARNRFAIVLDGVVVSAPTTQERIPTGEAVITGNFTQETAQTLANQLKFGALPVSFQVNTEDQISALLGSEQLQRGLLAGVIGLILVVLYSLAQYRALGLVTVFSLLVAAAFTYGLVLLLGWRQGYRLSLPGVAGLIVAIGITADSFIVFFERVRDEVRDGRGLQAAVESAWARARRTILASDTVSLIAAVVLYLLAVGGVRGFAFTLGLTTLVDVLVVFLFTKPTVALLARTKFFGGGHRLSGFDPEHLGRSVAYAGRARVRAPAARATIAERRAAQAREAAGGGVPDDRGGGADPTPAEQPAGTGRDA